MAYGIQTQIWNNNLKSLGLLAIYPVIVMIAVWLIALIYQSSDDLGSAYQGANRTISDFWIIIVGLLITWFAISYFYNTKLVARLAHAKPVTRKEEPELYNLMENLCISRGVKVPHFNIIESHALNAFASGIDEDTYTVTVTRGLLNRLSKDEVEAVLAHELVHIMNRDVRLMMVCIVFTGMFILAAEFVWNSIRFSRPRGGRNNGAVYLFFVVIVLYVGYFATVFTRLAISRKREYMADAGAVELTKNPEAMMRALMRISGRSHIPEASSDLAFMYIENDRPFLGLLATHPPIDKRIASISNIMGVPIPERLPPAAPVVEQISNDPSSRNPWLTRERRGL